MRRYWPAFTGGAEPTRRAYPAEFHARAIVLVRARNPQNQTAAELDIHRVSLSK